jgi:hypothetical protein
VKEDLEEEEKEEEKPQSEGKDKEPKQPDSEEDDEDDSAETLWAARTRQMRAASGLLGVYVAWAVLSYFTCANPP